MVWVFIVSNSSGVSSAGFGNDVFGDRQLADIVQQCGGSRSLQIGFVKAELAAGLDGIGFHPLQMIARILVLRLNRQGKRLDRPPVEGGYFLGMDALLLGPFSRLFQPPDVQIVRPVNDIDDRQQQ